MDKKQKVITGGIVALVVAVTGYYHAKNEGYKEGRNEIYSMWSNEGANGVNRAYGSWRYFAECGGWLDKSGVKWDETTVTGSIVENTGKLNEIIIRLPNFEIGDKKKPLPTQKMEARAKSLKKGLCIENEDNGETRKDREGYYEGSAYVFRLGKDNIVRFHTIPGRVKDYAIQPPLRSNEFTFFVPQRKSEKGTEETAKNLADFYFPDNKGIVRERE